MPSKYFKERKGFNRLFQLLRKKYISLGRYAGTVTLLNTTKEEAQDLTNFFGKRVEPGEEFKTSFKKIEKKLKETRYADFDWDQLFADYFGGPVLAQKEQKEQKDRAMETYFLDLENEIPSSLQNFYQQIFATNESLTQLLIKRYHKDALSFKEDLLALFKVISVVETSVPISLTMLSSFTGNPHFLDFKSQNHLLFIKLLALYYREKSPETTREKILFLKRHQIYIDLYSNYVITYLLRSESPVIESFYLGKEILNLNLSNLDKISKLDTDCKKVYVFENPSMVMALSSLEIPIVITSGIPNSVVYEVLEKLVSSGNQLYYNGDFDPEGLVISQKLKERFPNIQFFCYDAVDFEASISKETIPPHRLAKLEHILVPELETIKNMLYKECVAAYQEKNIQNIKDYIEKNQRKI